MVWEFVFGFVLLVIGTYIGATMALRGFFGRNYFDPRTGKPIGDPKKPGDEFNP